MGKLIQRLWQGWRDFLAAYTFLHERRQLRDRPWEEDLLHWSLDGSLHGHLSPPTDGRRRSVTSDGWCPAYPPPPSDRSA